MRACGDAANARSVRLSATSLWSAASSDDALQRRVQSVDTAGLGLGWTDGDLGHGPAYRYHTPNGHLGELYYETR